jgi:hypothetical protein
MKGGNKSIRRPSRLSAERRLWVPNTPSNRVETVADPIGEVAFEPTPRFASGLEASGIYCPPAKPADRADGTIGTLAGR